jgi:GxxExxY protein
MHPLYRQADLLSGSVIGAAIEVHRHKGPGLIESIYEKCLMRELELRGHRAAQQLMVPIEYKGHVFEEALRVDVLVESCLIVENKVVEKFCPSIAPSFSATCAS